MRRTTFLEKLFSRYLLVVGTLHYGSPLRISMTLIMKLGASQVVKMLTTILLELKFRSITRTFVCKVSRYEFFWMFGTGDVQA